MIEELKDLEQEAIDNITPQEYMDITSKVMREEDQVTYQCGYIDGLQTAIRIMSENSDTMNYTIEIDEMFGEDYARVDEDEDTN